LAFLFEEINASKRQLNPGKNANNKKRKSGSLLSTDISDINVTTNSDEGDQQEYFFTYSKSFSSGKTKLAKTSHPTTELVVSSKSPLNINYEEHLLRALADTRLVPEVASFMRHIPQSHSSKLITVIQTPGVQRVVILLQ
jgi:hypothetical protein